MLTPMLVQYLVGLCCLRHDPDAVDVTVGDYVLDVAAKKTRDVDITVTLNEGNGVVRAFKAYEVKRESDPLDVATVEQLCMKLRDMPAITHRTIVSASGFTSGATAKATAHDIQLLVLKPWTQPVSDHFPTFTDGGHPNEFLQFTSNLLYWMDAQLSLHAPDGPPSFTYDNSKPLFAADGSVHNGFPHLNAYRDALLFRSCGILYSMEPATTIARTFPAEPMVGNTEFEASPAWPHTHTLEVTEDQVYLKFDSGLALLRAVTISGRLQWQKRKRIPEFYLLEHIPTGEVFAGAAIADWGTPDGKMFAMIFSPESRATHIHTIRLLEKHKNAIRQLKIPLPIPERETQS
jgi:hypothetical protein